MKKRRLGQSQVEVTPIGLGGNKFSGGSGVFRFFSPQLKQEQVNTIIRAALDGGITLFDTAELYGFGRSELAIAGGLKAAGIADEDVIIVTKWSPFLRTASNLKRTINTRLRCLAGYAIDLYLIHFPYSFSSIAREMAAMAGLVEAGKIRAVGVSNFNERQMRQAHAELGKYGLPLAANQVQYSLLHRDIESNGILAAARELGVTIIAWGPLASGVLSGRYHRDQQLLGRQPLGSRFTVGRRLNRSRQIVETLFEIGSKYQASPSQVALNWLVTSQGENVVAIPGASSVEQVAQNAAALSFQLAEEDMARLDYLSADYR